MIIEIRKAGFTNKGAEMMLLSIIDRIKTSFPNATIAMAPTTEKGSQPYSKLSRLGIKLKFRLRRGRFDISWIGNIIPSKIREAYGIVLNKDIDVILDASGFSYSDQWGTYDTTELKDVLTKDKPSGQKFIFLPQAFGPFENKVNKDNITKCINSADLIFARDSHSMKSLNQLPINEPSKIIQSPDFTCGLGKSINKSVEEKSGKIAIVPNYRMLDKTDASSSTSYVDFLTVAVKEVLANNLVPYFLIHETDLDRAVAEKVISEVGRDIEIVEEENPKLIKGYLSVSKFVISSRYHASVSALCQSVPVIGTSWSHKYKELFREYDFDEGLIDVSKQERIKKVIDNLSDNEYRDRISLKLNKHSEVVKEQNSLMWDKVFEVIKTTVN
ncbi:TPA: polysaccharide pyruvyl transferase family protein [Vibrio vulnificus]|nr:polysaccharide pyruvyl transferase family protein [Vibrio vulnificus]HAS8445445.1 polysaccharide pyruvyl transferase family protein [Vibrio vulnificus]HAS8454900.1 polysaccharide pyruvyl transferase family protein [Vibrio vulnificus]HDY7725111.1 polysaccharide pyruvyl transferase family protein [Vibrio vulnificus]